MDELIKIKELLHENDSLVLKTKNLTTGWIGCASFLTNGEQKIRVFEGNGNGDNDHDVSYEEFIKNYIFTLEEE